MYQLVYQLIDFFTGFNISKELDNVLEMDQWTRQMIDNDQKEKFEKLSAFASSSVFYKEYAGKPLHEYPLMTREDYIRNFDKLRTDYNKKYYIQESSGSTGKPVTQYVTKDMLLAKRVSHQKLLKWYGLTRESREFKIGGLHASLIKKIYYYIRKKRFYNSFLFSNKNVPGIARAYNRFKPDIIYGYPSTINWFLLNAVRAGINLHPPVIMITHAENLYDDFIKNYKSVFPDVKVVNQYWCTESNMGVTCEHGNLHIDEDTVVCEVINSDENGIGDIHITNLYSYAIPVIRYGNGDRGKISEKPCPCGRNTKIIEKLDGRRTDYIETPDGKKFALTAILESGGLMDNILSYQLIYYKDKKKIVFRFVPLKNDRPIAEDKLKLYFRNMLALDVEFLQVENMEYAAGGKIKRLTVIE